MYLVAEQFLDTAISYATKDSNPQVVLLQDAAYASPKVKVPGQLYVMEEDVAQRGIRSVVPPDVHVINYDGLIAMIEKEKILNFL